MTVISPDGVPEAGSRRRHVHPRQSQQDPTNEDGRKPLTIFRQTKIADLVQVHPEDFAKRSIDAIEDNINAKYSNKVLLTSDSRNPSSHADVRFR